MGRSQIFNSPNEIEKAFDMYWEEVKKEGRVLTLAGFCNYLDISRQTIYNYSHREEYLDTIKRILSFIESDKWCALVNGRGSTRGLIFDLRINTLSKKLKRYKGVKS